MTIRLLILLVMSLTFGVAWAQSPLPADGSFSAKGHLQYLSDSSGRLTLAQVCSDSTRFQPVSGDIPQLADRQRPHWFRARLHNPQNQAVELVAEIDYPFLESVEYFLINDRGRLLARSVPIGWSMTAISRPFEHQNPLFAFTTGPHQQSWLYIRVVAGRMRLTVPLRLHTAIGFVRTDRQQRFFWDVTIGLMGFIVLLSLFLYVLLRDRIYTIYALYVLATLLYLTGNQGYWLLWLDRPMYGFIPALAFHIVSMYVAILASFWLIRVYVLPPVLHHNWVKRTYGVAIAGPLLSIGCLLGNTDHVLAGGGWPTLLLATVESISYMIGLLLMTGLVIYLCLRPKPPQPDKAATGPARLYMLAIALPLLQVVLGFLRERNLVPDQFINREGAAIGSMIEFMILIVALGYRYKRLSNERRELTAETFRQQQYAVETQLRLQQQENRALESQLQLQQEKERIARDLHDHVGAQLSVIAANANTPNGEQASLMGDYAREAMQSLRDTVWAIDQSAITLADFRSKLQQYLNRQQQQHPSCTYTLTMTAPTNPELTSAQALNLFRQVQEAVHNAFKHAHATAVTVHCNLVNDQLNLTVTDNGQGFDPEKLTSESTHYGLRNLQRRADELLGTCSIESEPGQGTRVSVTIPLVM